MSMRGHTGVPHRPADPPQGGKKTEILHGGAKNKRGTKCCPQTRGRIPHGKFRGPVSNLNSRFSPWETTPLLFISPPRPLPKLAPPKVIIDPPHCGPRGSQIFPGGTPMAPKPKGAPDYRPNPGGLKKGVKFPRTPKCLKRGFLPLAATTGPQPGAPKGVFHPRYPRGVPR